MCEGKSIHAMVLTDDGSEACVASVVLLLFFYRAKETDNMLSADVK
jgi:hypothetical protein